MQVDGAAWLRCKTVLTANHYEAAKEGKVKARTMEHIAEENSQLREMALELRDRLWFLMSTKSKVRHSSSAYWQYDQFLSCFASTEPSISSNLTTIRVFIPLVLPGSRFLQRPHLQHSRVLVFGRVIANRQCFE